jgi:hypothetical protein
LDRSLRDVFNDVSKYIHFISISLNIVLRIFLDAMIVGLAPVPVNMDSFARALAANGDAFQVLVIAFRGAM